LPELTHAGWPVDPGALAPFVLAILMLELTPGPNMAYLAALSLSEGRRAGLLAVTGVTVGLLVYLLLSVMGVAGALARAPALYEALRWAGVFYLFWLAWEAWSGAGETSPGEARGASPFLRGLIANLLNPKAAIFYTTLLPGFIAPDHGAFWRQALLFGGVHIAVSILVHTGIVFTASHAAIYATSVGAARLRRAMAVGVALSAVWLLWGTAR
jgi:threonine/homoserine/homoserine lactone efflux protein